MLSVRSSGHWSNVSKYTKTKLSLYFGSIQNVELMTSQVQVAPRQEDQLCKIVRGVVSPVLANVYLHYALNLWFERVVKPHCRGDALICLYAADFVCAFRYRDDAERFFRALPKRLKKFRLEVAPEKTQLLRFSRFHPSMRQRFTFLGFELY